MDAIRTPSMRFSLRFEALALCAATIAVTFFYFPFVSWWVYLLLFFTPDLGMLGYLVSPKVGAFTYNLLHHQGVALLTAVIGGVFGSEVVVFIGLLLLAHSAFDRIFGYGLKYATDFKDTHLGRIGN
jgi:hypothetical protein